VSGLQQAQRSCEMVVLCSVVPARFTCSGCVVREVAVLTAAGIACSVAVLYLASTNASQAANAMRRNGRFEDNCA
jgi:hypothetical protein